MDASPHNHAFAPLFTTNFWGVLNDNYLKTLASFTLMSWIAKGPWQSVLIGVTAGALVLPFILFSPLADRLTTLCSKRRIVRLAKWAELPIVLLAILGFITHASACVIAAVLLMGLQSALYSPAKYALVRDIGGVDRISTGMGGMEGVAFLAMLGGTVAASYAFNAVSPLLRYGALLAFSLLGLAFSYGIRAEEEPNRALHAISPLRYLLRTHRMAQRYPGINAVIITLSIFWWAAATLQMGMLVYGGQVLGLDAWHTGLMLAGTALGIVAGQVIAGFVDRRQYLLGATLLTGWIAAALFTLLYACPLSPLVFSIVLALLAFDMGFFKLPLDAEIQKVVKGPRLNTMLAYFNQVSFLFMLAASGTYVLVSWLWGPRAFLAVLAAVMFIVPIFFVVRYRTVFSFTGNWILTRRYAIKASGLNALDAHTTYLFLPNHPAMVDPMLVMATLWRWPVSPLCDELYFDRGGLSAAILRLVEAVRVPDLRRHRTAESVSMVKGLHDIVVQALLQGKHIIFYPAGHIWTEPDPRESIGTRQLAYNVCRALPSGVRVIGVRTSGLWGSIWSRKGRTRTPDFASTFAKAVALWFACLVTRRQRAVDMHFEDITDRVRDWSQASRLDFNRQLEDWYNAASR